ncbi:MAG: cbb3-type cytochrome c oxidase subunit I, partial [Acidobacteria bacterium]|nr:cbb3-type cytochrome c oxidase subunit I [Acidobacteriota bacterium]
MSSAIDDRSRVRLARAYAAFGGTFLLFGGLLALVLRWQLAAPGKSVPFVGRLLFPGSGGAVTPSAYTSLFTLHGTVMIFFAITPLLVSCLAVLTLPRLLGV